MEHAAGALLPQQVLHPWITRSVSSCLFSFPLLEILA